MPAGPIGERRARYAGTSTRVLAVEGEGPPLLLLHGYSDSADTWRPLLRVLCGDRAAVAVDLPGFGRADRVPPGAYLPVLDAFVAELVREHAAEGPVLVAGNSLGGVAALRAAHDADLPLVGIAPISPAGLGHAPWVDLISREPIVHRILTLPFPVPARAIRAGLTAAVRRLAYGDPQRADAEVLGHYAGHHPGAADVRRIVTGARSLMAELREGYAALETIACPVLLVWGERDVLVPIAGATCVLEAVPGSRLETLPGVGHCAQAEVPERVAELLVDFDRACREDQGVHGRRQRA